MQRENEVQHVFLVRSADSMKMYSQSKRGKIYENLDIL